MKGNQVILNFEKKLQFLGACREVDQVFSHFYSLKIRKNDSYPNVTFQTASKSDLVYNTGSLGSWNFCYYMAKNKIQGNLDSNHNLLFIYTLIGRCLCHLH